MTNKTESKQPESKRKSEKTAKKLPFVEPKLIRHDSLVKTTLFGGAGAQGAAALQS